MNILKNYFITIILFVILYSLSYTPCNSFTYPIKTTKAISSKFGMRTLNGNTHFHNGIDIPTIHNTPVYSMKSGIVKYVGFSKVYGMHIIINHNDGYKTMYGHLDENITLKKGDLISQNTIIGFVGPKYLSNGNSNGMTTGCHLHFTVYYNNKYINPLSLKYD